MDAKVITNDRSKTNAIVNQAAIALGIGALYFILCVLNPFNYLIGAASIASFANIRWANLLRAFVIASPGAAVGVAAGAHAFNVYSGKVVIGAYPIMPIIAVVVGLATYQLGQMWGRSTIKDLTLIGLYGLVMGLVTTLHLTTFAVIFEGSTWGELASVAATWKIFTHTIIPMLGYPIVRYVESIVKR